MAESPISASGHVTEIIKKRKGKTGKIYTNYTGIQPLIKYRVFLARSVGCYHRRRKEWLTSYVCCVHSSAPVHAQPVHIERLVFGGSNGIKFVPIKNH